MKKPDDGKGVFVMKKLTTRGLQALAGGPSRLRSGTTGSAKAKAPAAESPAMRAPVDSFAEVTIPRDDMKAPIALASDKDIDSATLLVGAPKPKLRDEDIETLMQDNPMVSPRPAAGRAAHDDARIERTAILEAPQQPARAAEPAPKQAGHAGHQMGLRTPPTLIHQQQAIPDEIRQLAIRALEAQKLAGQAATAGPPSQPAQPKSAVTPAPQKPQPGAPKLVKSGGKVQIVVRETKRRTGLGWTAMLLALGVFVGLSTVAVVHGDAKRAWDAARGSAQKRPEASPPLAVAPVPPAADPIVAALAPDSIAAPPPTAPAAALLAATDTKVADNKPTDVKDDAKAAPKPEPKPEVTKPDPAPKPQQKPSNAYASAPRAAPKADDDKPAAAKAAAPKPDPKPEPLFAAAPKPKPEPVAAKPKADPPPKTDTKPAGKDDDVAKISQMAQQQLGAALP